MSDISRRQLLLALRALDDGEFMDLVCDALSSRSDQPDDPGGESRLVLCLATRDFGEQWELAVIPTEGGSGSGAILHNVGRCRSCGVPLMSSMKRHDCPLCGYDVYLT